MKKHGPASVITALAILTVALVAAPPASAAAWYLPGASETPGQNGAYYSSTLWVTNTGTAPASVEFRFIPFAGTAAASPVVRTLQAGETREYERVLPALFTLARGAGTIVLVTDGSVVSTMSTANTADPKGTFGLAVRPVAEAELAGAGARHEVVFASHKADLKSASRTNVSAVLVDPNTSFTVVAYDPSGAELGRKTVSSATPVHWQESLGPIVGERDVPLGRVSFEVAAGRIAVYDSVVDNVTNDGFVIQGVPSTRARSQWLLAGLARAPGERNTFWTSDVWVHNPQATAIQVTFTPWLAGAAPFTRTVVARGILQIADVVGAGGFGLERGSGVVEVGSPAAFFVESRTYNSDPANPAAGTYSATVRAFTEDLLVRGPGQAAVNAAEASDAFRTNLTLFSPTGGALALKLLDQQGTEISRTTANLGARTSWQQSLAGWFTTGSSSVGTLSLPAGFKGTVVVDVPTGVHFQGYVSRVDNGTGDGMAPSFTPIQSCAPPAITSFTATPSSSTAGAPVTLALASTGCVSAKVTPGDLTIPCNGSITVNPTETREYTATATGACAPAATAKANVNIGCPAISVEVRASGATDLCEPDSVRLTATTTGCASCVISWERNGAEWTTGAYIDVSTAGTYSARARDAAGCTATSSPITVTTSPAPNPAITAPATVAGGSGGHAASVAEAGSGTAYAWAITNGMITAGQGTPAITFTAGSTGTVSLGVTVTSRAGCAASDTRSVGIDCTPPSATITAPASVCANATGQAASVPDAGGGATYAWTITNGTITAGAATRAITWTAVATGPVGISVTVQNTAGCTNTGNASVAVNPLPTISGLGVSPGATPYGRTATITFTVANAKSWSLSSSIGNAFSPVSGTSNGTISVMYSACCVDGTDTITLTATNDCGSTQATTTVVVCANEPDATISAPPSVAPGATFTASAMSVAGWSYVWSVSNGTITAGQGTSSVSVSAGTSGQVSLSLQVTVPEGCSATATKQVPIGCANPTISDLSVSPGTIELGQSATLTFTISDATSWSLESSLGNMFSASSGSGSGTITIGYDATNDSGTDTVTLTTINACGSASAQVPVVVTGCGTQGTQLSVGPRVCANSTGNTATVTYDAPMLGITWSVSNGTLTAGQGTPNMTYTAGASGSVSINVVVDFGGGCAYSTGTSVAIDESPVVTVSPGGPTTFCTGGSVTLTALPGGMSYLWSNGATTQSITTGTAGNYSVTVTNGSGCSNTSAPTTVTVNPTPSATITAPGSVCPLGTDYVASIPAAGPGSTYVWTSTNANIVTGQGSNSITFDTASAGPVTLNVTVTNGSGCTNTGSVVISMNPLPTISGVGISANPVSFGNTATISFTLTNATSWSVTSSLGNGISPSGGTGSGAKSVTYSADSGAGSDTVTITATNACGNTVQTLAVTVN